MLSYLRTTIDVTTILIYMFAISNVVVNYIITTKVDVKDCIENNKMSDDAANDIQFYRMFEINIFIYHLYSIALYLIFCKALMFLKWFLEWHDDPFYIMLLTNTRDVMAIPHSIFTITSMQLTNIFIYNRYQNIDSPNENEDTPHFGWKIYIDEAFLLFWFGSLLWSTKAEIMFSGAKMCIILLFLIVNVGLCIWFIFKTFLTSSNNGIKETLQSKIFSLGINFL